MKAHLRACLVLLGLTLAICCVLYPLALWAVGRAAFPDAASGSLVRDEDGTVRGSRLIAQPFGDAKYFWPRPSAVGYNASASGGSNLAASNPLLRDRVARQLGPIARYTDGRRAGPRVEAWFRANPGLLGRWAADNPTLAGRWVKDDANRQAVAGWIGDHPALLEAWRKQDPDARPEADKVKDLPDDLAAKVLEGFATAHPGAWPEPQKRQGTNGEEGYLAAKQPDPTGKEEIADLQSTLFDAWLQAHPADADRLEKVPADMVMASGSGLDPHITLRNALYQLDRVAEARAKLAGLDRDETRKGIEDLLRKRAFTPLAGLVGEPLVNVLEVNLALDAGLKPAGG
jgi:potassium-transporting ATPase KdpC subunit